jgi:virginiamycin A acetyltransferase
LRFEEAIAMHPKKIIRKVIITSKTIELFADNRIFFSQSGSPRIKNGNVISFLSTLEIESYSSIFKGSTIPERIGAFSYSSSPLDVRLNVGRYCSIASGLSVVGNSHPHKWVSTSPFGYQSFRNHANIRSWVEDQGKEFHNERFRASEEFPVIGNDVWIGQDVLLNRSIKIGNGSVVAARSLVTKDIPPYSIVGGIPARIIRRRFSDSICERLNRIQWWDYAFTDFNHISISNPEVFVESMEALVENGNINRHKGQVIVADDIVRESNVKE